MIAFSYLIAPFLEPISPAALEVEKEEEMKPAGMGRGDGLWHGKKTRGDHIVWITDGIRGTGKLPQVRTYHITSEHSGLCSVRHGMLL